MKEQDEPSPSPCTSPCSPSSPASEPAQRRRPSRLHRTLNSLRSPFRSPFRSGSPFHIGSIKRSGSTKSSASDGEITRDERTMRKKNKKPRAESSASGATRGTESAPAAAGEKVKKEGGSLLRRMGSIGRKRGEGSPAPLVVTTPEPEPELQVTQPRSVSERPLQQSEPQLYQPQPLTHQTQLQQPDPQPHQPEPQPKQDEPQQPEPEPPSTQLEELSVPENNSKSGSPNVMEAPVSPEPPVSPIAVDHAVATWPFTKAAWKRNKEPEMQKPIEEASLPESALRRRIAFVTQASACFSEDHDDEEEEEGDEGEVGSLQQAVALARVRLAPPAQSGSPSLHSRDSRDAIDTEEEGCADDMPPTPTPTPYGDLMEPGAPSSSSTEDAPEPSHSSPSAERREHLYKILVIGELGTGKTSIIKRYVHQFFSQHYRATIGVDFALKVLNWDANTIIRLQLWDIAGQERFGNMTRVYYKEAVGAFIVFDVSRVATFDAVVKWKNDLDSKVQLPDGSPIPCILLANKCDQQKEGLVNSAAKMEEYCREKGFAGWFETSAKENINIEEAARSLVNKILLNDKLLQSSDGKDGDKFALDHKIANGENNRDDGGSKSCAC